MDRLHVLRDTANLPRAVAPSYHPTQCEEYNSSNDSGVNMKVDDSLTDMQWLHRMDAGSDFPGLAAKKAARKRMRAANKENYHLKHRDGCRKKLDYGEKTHSTKPPLSYASLIVLAICSTPQRMMTLSGIYRWIESTFPFYCTPESKAWKNSVRHNLSIRKNMFQKVYQFPPRRGNGSYWTLLADGDEELKKAYPLFTTLLPPIIDTSSVYCRTPTTHVVKSRGQYVPVLPHSNRREPYFALQRESSVPNSSSSVSLVDDKPQLLSTCSFTGTQQVTSREGGRGVDGGGGGLIFAVSSTPKHLLDHNYTQTLFNSSSDLCCSVLASGNAANGLNASDYSTDEPNFKQLSRRTTPRLCSPVRKRHKSPLKIARKTLHSTATGEKTRNTAAICTTPVRSSPDDQADPDCSLNLLASTFLTPMKNMIPDIGLETISLSPLYNFVTPQRGGTPQHTASASSTSSSSFSSSSFSLVPVPSTALDFSSAPLPSLTPISSSNVLHLARKSSDSFSPILAPLRFSPPLITGVSPVGELPGNVFDTPQPSDSDTPLRLSDLTSVSNTTPSRSTSSRDSSLLPGRTLVSISETE